VVTELKRLVKELVFGYVEIVGRVTEGAGIPEIADRIQQMWILLVNIHHLINSYRPHQARHTLIHTIQTQIDNRNALIRQLLTTIEQAKANLQELAVSLETNTSNPIHSSTDENEIAFREEDGMELDSLSECTQDRNQQPHYFLNSQEAFVRMQQIIDRVQ